MTATGIDQPVVWKSFEGSPNQLWRVKVYGQYNSTVVWAQLVSVGMSTPALDAVVRAPDFTQLYGFAGLVYRSRSS